MLVAGLSGPPPLAAVFFVCKARKLTSKGPGYASVILMVSIILIVRVPSPTHGLWRRFDDLLTLGSWCAGSARRVLALPVLPLLVLDCRTPHLQLLPEDLSKMKGKRIGGSARVAQHLLRLVCMPPTKCINHDDLLAKADTHLATGHLSISAPSLVKVHAVFVPNLYQNKRFRPCYWLHEM